MSTRYSIELPQASAGSGYEDQGLPVTIKSIVDVVYRRYWIIAIGFLTVFSLVAYMTFTATPVYTAKATVIVDTKERNVIDLGSVIGGVGGNTAEIDTEVEIMGSKSLLTRVVRAQNLVEDPEFNPHLNTGGPKGAVGQIKGFLRGLVGGNKDKDVDPFEGMTEDQKNAKILEDTTNNFSRHVDVKRVGTTFLINAEVYSVSAQKSADLANAVADQYRVDQLEAKLETTQRATNWLLERVSGLRDEVSEKERRVEEYRSESGLLAAAGTSLTEQEIASLSSQKIQQEALLNRARARFENVRRAQASGTGVDSIAEVLNNPVISDLKSQQAVVLRRQADLESTLGSRHPDLIRVRSEAADIERAINVEVQKIITTLENEVQAAQDEVNKLNAAIGRARGQLIQNNRNQVRLNELERDAEASRVLYEDFISRAKETGEQDDLAEADARILSTASVPVGPSSPKTMINLVLGVLLGGMFGIGLAMLAEMFDMHVSSTEDVERKLRSKSIGSIPFIPNRGILGLGKNSPPDFMTKNPLSAYAESVRYLRAAIAFSDLDSQTKTVAITSSLPNEGKTSLTLSLGRMSAMSGSRTLVIDGDFRRRELTRMVGISPKIGFIEHLFGAGSLDEAIHRDTKSSLDILPLSKTGHTPHDVFGTRAFDDLLEVLKQKYDSILIDTGPLLLMAEARVIAGKADKTILIVRWRHTSRGAARQSLNLLKNFNANLLGVALNMVNLTSRRHHKDPSASNKAYSKYYSMGTRNKLFGSKDKLPPVQDNPIPRPAAALRPANEETPNFVGAPEAKEPAKQAKWSGSSTK
ncbi:MAG: GumC family protein [Henriciella sp.]|nr:polysaccharide biosynthesis tyrosine autokinase [Hyphomonadaceae bacterium]